MGLIISINEKLRTKKNLKIGPNNGKKNIEVCLAKKWSQLLIKSTTEPGQAIDMAGFSQQQQKKRLFNHHH